MPLPAAPRKPADILEDYGPEPLAEAPAAKASKPARTAKAAKAVKAADPAARSAARPRKAARQQAILTAPAHEVAPEAPEAASAEWPQAKAPAVAALAPKASGAAAEKPARPEKPAKPEKPTKAAKPGKAQAKDTKAQEAAPAARREPAAKPHVHPRKAASGGPRKIFVLDTNVLLHDPASIFRFEEHDVYLPMITLEELDNHKTGLSDVARNARQVSRTIDALAAASREPISAGILIDPRTGPGRLFFQTEQLDVQLPSGLPVGKADNLILGVVRAVQKKNPDRPVVLVSKDINMRIKAAALGLPAEDYFNDKTLEDTDLLYTGVLQLPENFWESHAKGMESWQESGSTWYRIQGPSVPQLAVNQFVWLEDPARPFLARVASCDGKSAVLRVLRDYTLGRNAVWGITARNREQAFSLDLLTDPEIDFVTIVGQAGSGKTLMALAAGLAQTLDERRYTEIIVTRATVPVGEDIGFLPGTEEEKMAPWMGALEDNLDVLNRTDSTAGDWGRSATNDIIRSRVRIKSMSFMRGRTFQRQFVIIDEAQNLTPKQMKTLITRAGPGTKIVCLGNIGQIDTPYLTEGSSGLTYVVDRLKGWEHAGHVTLQRGERSRLADWANEAL